MNRLLASLFFCFLCLFCNAQREITIIDFFTKKPVSYATVRFYSNSEILGGEYCNEDGKLVIPKLKKEINRIGVSCVGYENDNYDLNTTSSNILFLKPQETVLKEVVISKKKPISLFKYSNIEKGRSNLPRSQTEVVYIPNDQSLNGVLKTFSFKLSKKVKLDQIVRMHVYAKSDLKFEPGVSLLNENVIKNLPKGTNGDVEIDLLPYEIALPKEGLFIGLENIGPKLDIKDFKYNQNDYKEGLYFYAESTNDFKTFLNFNLFKENSFWIDVNTFTKEDMKKSFNEELKIGSNPAFNVTIIPN